MWHFKISNSMMISCKVMLHQETKVTPAGGIIELNIVVTHMFTQWKSAVCLNHLNKFSVATMQYSIFHLR